MTENPVTIYRLKLHGPGKLWSVKRVRNGVVESEYYSSQHLAIRDAILACAGQYAAHVVYDVSQAGEVVALSLKELLEKYIETEDGGPR